jgi:tripartite-type tricarboxylate transporter receptor subunit TctC
VVENKSGGSGTVGSRPRQKRSDGYTVLIAPTR